MIRIDDTLLEEIGLIALPKQDRDQLLRQIYETLEMRVGMRLAERMNDQQLDEFERFIDSNDEAGALKWLETNFPDYKQVVADELEKLKGEIKKDAPKIMETMQQGGGAASQSGQPTSPGVGTQPQPVNYNSPASPPPYNPPTPVSQPQPFQAPQSAQPVQQQPLPPLPTQPIQQAQPQNNHVAPQSLTPMTQDEQNNVNANTDSPQQNNSNESQDSPKSDQGGFTVPPPPKV